MLAACEVAQLYGLSFAFLSEGRSCLQQAEYWLVEEKQHCVWKYIMFQKISDRDA